MMPDAGGTFDTSAPAPFLAALADGPATGHAVWRATPDGIRIRVGLWPLAEGAAKGTVLLFPGRTEYVEKYGRAAADFAARGYAMAAVDWRGQGLADRLLDDPMTGHVFDFLDYQQDAGQMLAAVRDAGLPEPYYLVAHSMGGCIGLRSLVQDFPVRAAAFSAPMWGIRISPRLRPLAWALGWGLPRVGQGARYVPGTSPTLHTGIIPFEGNVLTTDPGMYAYMQAQTLGEAGLRLAGPSVHWLFEALVETRRLRGLPRPAVPVLTQIGTAEKVVDTAAVDQVMAGWPGATFTRVPGAEHEIMMETPPRRAGFFDAAAALFAKHP